MLLAGIDGSEVIIISLTASVDELLALTTAGIVVIPLEGSSTHTHCQRLGTSLLAVNLLAASTVKPIPRLLKYSLKDLKISYDPKTRRVEENIFYEETKE